MKQHTHNVIMEVMKARKKSVPSTTPTISAAVRLSAVKKQQLTNDKTF